MPDLAAARRTHAACLADRVGREVVVQQEGFLAGSGEFIDVLLILAGAERCNDQSLRLAAGEERRAMGARQNADLRHNRANRLEIASVDTRGRVKDVPAYDLGLEILEHRGDLLGRPFRLLAFGRRKGRFYLGLDRIDRSIALLLVGYLVGLAQIRLGDV